MSSRPSSVFVFVVATSLSVRDAFRALGAQGLRALWPALVVLLLLAAVLAAVSLAGPIAPFVYPLF